MKKLQTKECFDRYQYDNIEPKNIDSHNELEKYFIASHYITVTSEADQPGSISKEVHSEEHFFFNYGFGLLVFSENDSFV